MDNIQNILHPNEGISYQMHSFGNVTLVQNEQGISAHYEVLKVDDTRAVYCMKLYNSSTYDTCYFIVNKEGKVLEKLVEQEGVLPSIFKGPDGSLWTKITSTKMDGSKEITLPLRERDRIAFPKTSRELVGDLLGTIGNTVYYYHNDIWNKQKPDKLFLLSFNKKGLYQKRKGIKLPMPKGNRTYFDMANEALHLMCTNYEQQGWLHRQVSLIGEVLQERFIAIPPCHYVILKASFVEDSYCLTADGGRINLVKISPDNRTESTTIYHDEATTNSEFGQFYRWEDGVALGESKFFVKFGGEGANGWLIASLEGKIIELFVKEGDDFVNPLSNERISLGASNLAVGEIVGWEDQQYVLSLYSVARDNKEFRFLARSMNS
jgi:hypothetical protein